MDRGKSVSRVSAHQRTCALILSFLCPARLLPCAPLRSLNDVQSGRLPRLLTHLRLAHWTPMLVRGLLFYLFFRSECTRLGAIIVRHAHSLLLDPRRRPHLLDALSATVAPCGFLYLQKSPHDSQGGSLMFGALVQVCLCVQKVISASTFFAVAARSAALPDPRQRSVYGRGFRGVPACSDGSSQASTIFQPPRRSSTTAHPCHRLYLHYRWCRHQLLNVALRLCLQPSKYLFAETVFSAGFNGQTPSPPFKS